MGIDRRARRREGAAAHVHRVLPSCLMLSASSVGELRRRAPRAFEPPAARVALAQVSHQVPRALCERHDRRRAKGCTALRPARHGQSVCRHWANPSASASVGRVPGVPPPALPCFWDLACAVSSAEGTAVDRWATLRFTALAPDDACKGRRDRERRRLHRPPPPPPPP